MPRWLAGNLDSTLGGTGVELTEIEGTTGGISTNGGTSAPSANGLYGAVEVLKALTSFTSTLTTKRTDSSARWTLHGRPSRFAYFQVVRCIVGRCNGIYRREAKDMELCRQVDSE